MTLNFEMQLLQALKDIADNIENLTDSVNWLSDQIEKQRTGAGNELSEVLNTQDNDNDN